MKNNAVLWTTEVISSVKTEHMIAVLHMIESDIPTHGMQ